MIEGVYLSSLLPGIRGLIEGRSCTGVELLVPRDVMLRFGEDCLLFSPDPASQSISWLKDAGPGVELPPVWTRHLVNASVTGVSQQGADRVLDIGFTERGPYSTDELRLVFEITGRNSNLILVRKGDSRILAVLREVTKRMSRFRTLAPGGVYHPPPPSGAPLERWEDDPGICDALSGSVTESEVYSLLEGVGPVTARALILEARLRGTTVHHQVSLLARAIGDGAFHQWMSPEGPLPVRLGPGRDIADPLSPVGSAPEPVPVTGNPMEGLKPAAEREIAKLERKIRRLEEVIADLVPGELYRLWGELLISADSGGRRGKASVDLTDWEGRRHHIPLRASRTLRENAARYFRKARSAGTEADHLQSLLETTRNRLSQLESILEKGDPGSAGRLAELLDAYRRKRTGKVERRPLEITLSDGWRCIAGRNGPENDRVTFRIGKRGDYWFHARGTTGAHVVLKMDGRSQNPPAAVLREAASVAAVRCSVSSGVVPVDYTRVQYVRKQKGGKPGQVLYTREKSLFIDLDRPMPPVLDSTKGNHTKTEGEKSES